MVHNGIVENYRELKEELAAVGHVFRSETDTEVLAHLIENHERQFLLFGSDSNGACSSTKVRMGLLVLGADEQKSFGGKTGAVRFWLA